MELTAAIYIMQRDRIKISFQYVELLLQQCPLLFTCAYVVADISVRLSAAALHLSGRA